MRSRLVVAFAVIALAGSACTTGTRWAASVDGVKIGVSALTDELEAIRGNEAYWAQVVQSMQASGVQASGPADGTFSAELTAQVLNRQVLFQLVHQAIEEMGVTVTDAHLERGRADTTTQLGGDAVVADFDPAYVDLLARRTAEIFALQEALAGDDQPTVEEYFDEHRADFEQVCLRHMLLGTEAEAVAARDRVLAGEDFAAVATEVSQDPGSAPNGGDLGCQTRGVFDPTFEAAAFAATPGEVTDVVETQFGFHVILVDERVQPELDAVRSQVQQAVDSLGAQALNDWFLEAITSADVEVNPRYGSWSDDEAQPRVVPPAAPERPASAGATTTPPTQPLDFGG